MSSTDEPKRPPAAPSPQNDYQRATELGFEALSRQSKAQMLWLGAEPSGGHWRLPVLEGTIEVDVPGGRVSTPGGEDVSVPWRILVLHYLAVTSRPERHEPQITFADLPMSRSYTGVYQGRVVSRLCATAGRDAEKLCAAARAIGGQTAAGGDAAFDFDVFPRLSLRLIWHAPDDEFPPSATLLLPDNIKLYFCAEDVVVLSESLVARLGGRP